MGNSSVRAVAAVAFLLAGCATADCGCHLAVAPHLTLALPADFSCKTENQTRVCESANHERSIVYGVRPAGSDDSLERYRARFPDAKVDEINGVKWIDADSGFSAGSVAGRRSGTNLTAGLGPRSGIDSGTKSRMLATVDGELAVSVTFTAKESDFPKFNEEIEPIIGTLILRR